MLTVYFTGEKKYVCAIEQGSGGLWDNNTEILHTKIKKCAQVSTVGFFSVFFLGPLGISQNRHLYSGREFQKM